VTLTGMLALNLAKHLSLSATNDIYKIIAWNIETLQVLNWKHRQILKVLKKTRKKFIPASSEYIELTSFISNKPFPFPNGSVYNPRLTSIDKHEVNYSLIKIKGAENGTYRNKHGNKCE